MSLSFFSPPPRPADERARQQAVDRSGLLRAPPDPILHAIVAEAARLLGSPMAALSVVDREQQWFAAQIGLAIPTVARAASFCAHAILTPDEPFVVPDAAEDERFAGNPLVQLPPHIRFYAGVAVLGTDGQPLGALCTLDRRPQRGELPLDELAGLARQASRAIVAHARAMQDDPR